MAKYPQTFPEVFHGGPAIIRWFSRKEAPCGFFFADRLEVAESWATETATSGGGYVVSAEVILLDPLVIEAGGAHWSEVPDPWDSDSEREIDAIARDAEAAGFDGVVIHQVQDGADTMNGATNTTIIAFHPKQVRIVNPAAAGSP